MAAKDDEDRPVRPSAAAAGSRRVQSAPSPEKRSRSQHAAAAAARPRSAARLPAPARWAGAKEKQFRSGSVAAQQFRMSTDGRQPAAAAAAAAPPNSNKF